MSRGDLVVQRVDVFSPPLWIGFPALQSWHYASKGRSVVYVFLRERWLFLRGSKKHLRESVDSRISRSRFRVHFDGDLVQARMCDVETQSLLLLVLEPSSCCLQGSIA